MFILQNNPLSCCTVLYCPVLGICNMVQGVGRHAMSSFVLLEGMGAYGLLLLAPVEGFGGPLGGGGRYNQKPRTKLLVLLLLLLLRDCCLRRFFCAKIFEGAYVLSKHLPVFLLGTENVMGGGWQ